MGKTQKGKQRIREWGTKWSIKKESANVIFSGDRGMWFFVVPTDIPSLNGRDANVGSRWIHSTRDPDFKVLEN